MKMFKEIKFEKDEFNLLEFWSNTLNDTEKKRREFYARSLNPPNSLAPLYTNLKIEEGKGGSGG